MDLRYFSLIVLLFIFSCSKDIEEVNALMDKEEIKSEMAYDIQLIYSDSAEVKMRIEAPLMKRNIDKAIASEEFEKGLKAEFFGPNKRVKAWLTSKYAIRKEGAQEIVVRDSVELWNENKDKLETSELIWNEADGTMYTNKFVRISQPSKGDTSYGYGFLSNADFTKFEIKNKFSSKMSAEEISKSLGN